MKTIKEIVFATMILVAIISAISLFVCMCVCEVYNILAYIKWVLASASALGVSSLLVKRMYERWYK